MLARRLPIQDSPNTGKVGAWFGLGDPQYKVHQVQVGRGWENPSAKFARYTCGRTLMQSSPGTGREGVWENPNAKINRYRYGGSVGEL